MPPAESLELKDDAHCFVCGKENVNGLQLTWITAGRATDAEFIPSRVFQGWQGLVHGGILSTVLDEAMTRLAWEVHGGAVTGEITVRFLAPARVGERLTIHAELAEKKGRLIPAWAEIKNADGRVVARATGKAFLPLTKRS